MKKAIMIFAAMAMLAGCTKGDKGDPGNANVKTTTGQLAVSNWTWDATQKINYVAISVPDITDDIVSSGTVTVFASSDNITWTALPFSKIKDTYTEHYLFAYTLGAIEIQFQRSDFANINPGALYLKITTISAQQRQAHPHTDWTNYNQVMAATQPALTQ